MKDFISARDLSKGELLEILDIAEKIKSAVHDPAAADAFYREYGKRHDRLMDGKKFAVIFEEPSTRTFFSHWNAAQYTGGLVAGFSDPAATSRGTKGETWADTTAMFQEQGVDAVVMRSRIEGLPRWTREWMDAHWAHSKGLHDAIGKPYAFQPPRVINGGDGTHDHLTQLGLDLFTMREFARPLGRDLEGLEIALLNDIKHSRVLGSLMSVAPLFGWTVHFAYPERFGPTSAQVEELTARGVKVFDHQQDFLSAMSHAVFAYQSRPQKERVGAGEDLERVKQVGMITPDMYDQLGPLAPWLMHALPVDSKTFEEVHHSMRLHPKFIAYVQAGNGMSTRTANYALCFGVIPSRYAQRERERVSIDIEELSLSSRIKDDGIPMRSMYITDTGLVLDHLPAGWGRRIDGVLGLEKTDLPVDAPRYIPPRDGSAAATKDMIKIHAPYRLSDKQWEALALLAEGNTVSDVVGGRVTRKRHAVRGNHVEGIVRCGNAACVTNEPIEHVVPVHWLESVGGKTILRCNHCEQADTLERAYKENRFIYLG